MTRNSIPAGSASTGDVFPSKALLHAAKVVSESRDARELGITFSEPRIDVDKLRGWKNDIVAKLTGGLGLLTKQRKITFIQGKATFVDSNTVKVQKTGGPSQNIRFEHAILATGSRPVTLPNLPDSPLVLNSTTALELQNIPSSLLVVGGGYIGLELGTVYAELGSEVSVVEMTQGLLPGADRDLVTVLEKRLKTIFKSIMLGTKVAKVEPTVTNVKVTFENPDGKTSRQTYDKILVAIGRKPNSSDLGLEKYEGKSYSQRLCPGGPPAAHDGPFDLRHRGYRRRTHARAQGFARRTRGR